MNVQPGKVSVIIPTYDRKALLERALASVARQTYHNLEVIVVDDGSAEDIKGVVEGFSGLDLHYLKHPKNRGVAAARNTGVSAATGELVTFLDSDDEYCPEKVAKQVAHLLSGQDDFDVSYCKSELFSDEKGIVLRLTTDFVSEGNVLPQVLRNMEISMNGILVRSSDLEKIGPFDESLRTGEDWDFLIRLAKAHRFGCLNEVLVREHTDLGVQLTRQNPDFTEHRYRILQTHEDLYRKDKGAHGQFLFDQAYLEAIEGRRWRAVKCVLRSMVHQPFRRDAYVRLLMIVANRYPRRAP